MKKSYIGDIGTELRFDTGSDISDATIMKIIYEKPSGATGTWAGSLLGTTKINYVTQADDWDETGKWTYQIYIETPSWTGHGDKVDHKIYEIIN